MQHLQLELANRHNELLPPLLQLIKELRAIGGKDIAERVDVAAAPARIRLHIDYELTKGDHSGCDDELKTRITSLQARRAPILCCPLEVLMNILDLCAEEHRKPATVAQVCHYMRCIALQTPSLWQFITVPVGADHNTIKEFWGTMVTRVKAIPAIVNISYLNMGSRPSLTTDAISLSALPHIQELTLSEVGPTELDKLMLLRDLPTGTLGSFALFGTTSYQSDQWDCAAFLSKLPPFDSLTMEFLHSPSSWTYSFPAITKASFAFIYGPFPIIAFIAGCPFLRELYLEEMEIQQNASCITYQSLHTLELIDVGMAISHLPKLPNLVKLKVSGGTLAYNIGQLDEVLKNCVNLVELEVHVIPIPAVVASAARHVRRLTADILFETIKTISDCHPPSSTAPPFPLLETLILREPGYRMRNLQEIPPSAYDSLIENRFLPRDHPRSNLPLELEPITTLVIPTGYLDYLNLECYPPTKQVSVPGVRTMRTVVLSWVEDE